MKKIWGLWNTQCPLVSIKHRDNILPVFVQRFIIIRGSCHCDNIDQNNGIVQFERVGIFNTIRGQVHRKVRMLGIRERDYVIRLDLRILKCLRVGLYNGKRLFEGLTAATIRHL